MLKGLERPTFSIVSPWDAFKEAMTTEGIGWQEFSPKDLEHLEALYLCRLSLRRGEASLQELMTLGTSIRNEDPGFFRRTTQALEFIKSKTSESSGLRLRKAS